MVHYAQPHAFSYVVSSFSRFASVDKLIGEGGVLSSFGPGTTRYSTPARFFLKYEFITITVYFEHILYQIFCEYWVEGDNTMHVRRLPQMMSSK